MNFKVYWAVIAPMLLIFCLNTLAGLTTALVVTSIIGALFVFCYYNDRKRLGGLARIMSYQVAIFVSALLLMMVVSDSDFEGFTDDVQGDADYCATQVELGYWPEGTCGGIAR